MKKLLFLAVFAFFVLSSCEKIGPGGMIWDFSPLEFCFVVKNANGANLADSTVAGNILKDSVKVMYRGNTYKLGEEQPRTKAYSPRLWGLCVRYPYNGTTPYIYFGELDATHEFVNEELIIDWGDGRQDIITFSSKLKWRWKKPYHKGEIRLNGLKLYDKEPRTSSPIEFVK